MYFEHDDILYESRFTAISRSVCINTAHHNSGLYLVHVCVCMCMCVHSLYVVTVLLLTSNACIVSNSQQSRLKAPLDFQTEPLRWTAGEMRGSALKSHVSVCICSVSSEAVKVKPNKQPSAIYAHITSTCSVSKLQTCSETSQQHKV